MTAAPPAAGAALELILRATVLIGAAWVAAAILRRTGASAAARHMAWLLGIFSLLTLPLVWWLAPPLRLQILRPEEPTPAMFVPEEIGAPPLPAGASVWSLIFALYLTGAAAMLLRFLLSRHLVARLWRDAEPARDADWQALLAEISREMRLARPTQLRIARGPAMPMTWGTLAPRILLPAEAHLWTAEQRRLVLLHELAHVARRDSLARSVASLACALYWFHPGAWFVAQRLRLEQEHAADDRVLKAGARPKSYARSLLDIAYTADETHWPGHAVAMAGACQLERRVVAITSAARREAPGAAFHSASAAITALTVLAVAATLPVRPLPAFSALPAIEASSPSAQAVPAPVEAASDTAAFVPARAAGTARADERTQVSGGGARMSAATAPQARMEQAEPVALAAQEQAAAMPQEAPTPARTLGPIGPRLEPPPQEQETDPRIPAGLRRGSAERSANQRVGPGPPRTHGEALLRRLPTAILRDAGVLPSR
jgi:beta-lactamase regulating signal transducer with metallopeptidase domain